MLLNIVIKHKQAVYLNFKNSLKYILLYVRYFKLLTKFVLAKKLKDKYTVVKEIITLF